MQVWLLRRLLDQLARAQERGDIAARLIIEGKLASARAR